MTFRALEIPSTRWGWNLTRREGVPDLGLSTTSVEWRGMEKLHRPLTHWLTSLQQGVRFHAQFASTLVTRNSILNCIYIFKPDLRCQDRARTAPKSVPEWRTKGPQPIRWLCGFLYTEGSRRQRPISTRYPPPLGLEYRTNRPHLLIACESTLKHISPPISPAPTISLRVIRGNTQLGIGIQSIIAQWLPY